MQTVTDDQLELERLCGEIHLVLEFGTHADKLSMLRLIETLRDKETRDQLQAQYGICG